MTSETVLIIDDSATMRRMLGATLRLGGYEVVECPSGREALRQAVQREFNLVITDFNMPEINGEEVVRSLRGLPAYRQTPILVLTTDSGEQTKQQVRAAGATGWLGKPFEPTKLLSVLKQVTAPK